MAQPTPLASHASWFSGRIRFDRNECAGAFGDIGTALPLIVGIILASGADSASVLVCFGLLQIFTGVLYGIPMPVQPLKAVAVLVIAQRFSPSLMYGAGLSIGLIMLTLTVTGAIEWLGRVVPHAVIRGIQFGLGLQLASLALTQYVPAEGAPGYLLAAAGFTLAIIFLPNKRYPAALLLIAIGLAYALIIRPEDLLASARAGIVLPLLHTPSLADLWQGLVLLALPQIPLSLGNSLLATRQVARDFFPEKHIGLRSIGLTYSFMNLISAFLGGIPVCHGSGGLVGHYTFGARTGGSVLLSGLGYVTVGLFFSEGFTGLVHSFPLPILGVILLIEALALMRLVRDTSDSRVDFAIALLVGVMAMGLPYGYLAGMIVGIVLTRFARRSDL